MAGHVVSATCAGTWAALTGEVNDVARILIVDDDRSIRRTLEKFLGGEGYDVATAMDAPGAVAATDESADVMLLDPRAARRQRVRRAVGARGSPAAADHRRGRHRAR
jgi:DNA-binding NarL/FixJ family response regulator